MREFLFACICCFGASTGNVRLEAAIIASAAPPRGTTEELNLNNAAPLVRINEFLAANESNRGLTDEDGELQDWIEIYNSGAVPVNLEGWSLSDDADDPGRWVFPAATIDPGQFLVVFGSGKDRKSTGPGARFHTNFKLRSAGEYLGLLNPESPRVPVSEFRSSYPEQRNDYSFGFDASDRERYFRSPTPGRANGSSLIEGVVPPPHVNVTRGWFDVPFTLHITSPLPGAEIRYTTDGSEPTETNGQTYTKPLGIARTTTLRTGGFKNNVLPSTVSSHTYLFVEDILRQSNNPPGFPTGPTVMGGFPADYEMDPEIVNDPLYRGVMKDALLALPAISLVCRTEDMFGVANGIYTHPMSRGAAWERPCSVEFITSDGEPGFQATAGVQIQGNAAREPRKQPKHPFRLVFKGDYGPARLDFPLFPDSPVSSFDTLVLRADFNFSWLHWDPNQRIKGQRTRDAWLKDSMRAMGGLASHNRYVHLFINGLYWGIYDPSERPDGAFAASYLGGEKGDYDVMNEGAVVDGGDRAYNEMLGISNLTTSSAFDRMRTYLDLPQFIDYMLLHFYAGHQDWGRNKNWYAVRPKDGSRGFFYVPWDGENLLDSPTYNRVSNSDTPSGLHTALLANPEYRLAFADRVQKHFFHGGALTPAAAEARWLNRARQVNHAIVAESARWGDYRRDVHSYQNGPYFLYTRNNQWIAEQERLLRDYFPRRTGTVLGQLRSAGLYPSTEAPEFSKHGGRVPSGFALSLSLSSGFIYFTTDGTDPRNAETGAVSLTAQSYASSIFLRRTARIRARALRGGIWSALTEADFQVAEPGLTLRITEIMYHPPDGDAFEFIELQHAGQIPLDVSGFSFSGIDFIFPHGVTVSPNQILVLASSLSPSSFSAQYPNVTPAGYFKGSLSNGGEKIELRDREGKTVTAVTYLDSGAWPKSADGEGASLEIADDLGDPNDPANWFARRTAHGSPGARPPAPIVGSLRLNEILAKASEDGTEADANTDWIELSNTGAAPISLAGWILTDHGDEPFVFPQGAEIKANGFLLIYCDGRSDTTGLHAPFKLNQEGETVALYDSGGDRIDAISFGQQIPGFSAGQIGPTLGWGLLHPTPGAPNLGVDLAPASALKINEWLANPRPGDKDWFELYNSNPSRPAALGGLILATEDKLHAIQALTFIPPGGFFRLYADNRIAPQHIDIRLPAASGRISILDSIGVELDRVDFTAQEEGVSSGRSPDGSSSIVSFAGQSSPGQSNTLVGRGGVVLNELSAGANGTGGWVELFNTAASSIDLSGFQLSLGRDGGQSWAFPAGSRISGLGFEVVHFDPTQAPSTGIDPKSQTGRSINASGGSVHLRNSNGGIIDLVEFGFQIEGQSIGRSGAEWRLLSVPTRGASNASLAILGETSRLRFNEWFALSPDEDDWFELFNPELHPVSLSGLELTDNASLSGRGKFAIGPLSYVRPGGWVVWRADSSPGKGPDHLNFGLDQFGESLRLYAADGTIIDAIDFGPQRSGVSEGRTVDGGIEIGPMLAGPTRGRSNTAVLVNVDRDADGLPDDWEVANGTDPALPDADGDPDGDGMTNAQEFIAGTYPQDAKSSLRVLRVSVQPGSVSLEFLALPDHSYSVLVGETVTDSSWRKLADIRATAESRVERIVDSEPIVNVRFYRLVTPSR